MIERYSSAEMRKLWSESTKYNLWQDIERAYLYDLGDKVPAYMPDDEFNVLLRTLKTKITPADIKVIQKYEAADRHEITGFLRFLEGKCRTKKHPNASRWIHYGLTSSDITDTCLSMRLNQANELITKAGKKVLDHLQYLIFDDKNHEHKLMGRTHGMFGEPITFSRKFRIWYHELDDVLKQFKMVNLPGKASGSMGNFAHRPAKGDYIPRTRIRYQTTQIVPRHLYAVYFNNLALIGAVIERIATEIRLYSRSGDGIISEGFGKTQVGSSSMPHKKNPIASENLCGLARMLRGYASTAMENVALWHERDISHSSVERIIAPDATSIAEYMLQRLLDVLHNLNIDYDLAAGQVADSYKHWGQQTILHMLIRAGMKRSEATKWIKSNTEMCSGWVDQTSLYHTLKKYVEEDEAWKMISELNHILSKFTK